MQTQPEILPVSVTVAESQGPAVLRKVRQEEGSVLSSALSWGWACYHGVYHYQLMTFEGNTGTHVAAAPSFSEVLS